MDDRENPGWSRSEWARWWLDHDEVDEAARALEPGDQLELGQADFRDLAAALARRGLTAHYADRNAFVYTPAQAQHHAQADLVAGAVATSERRPPARSAAPASPEFPAFKEAKATKKTA